MNVPGDKSITQRALIVASLSHGRSHLKGLLTGADPQATATCLEALGARFLSVDWQQGSATIAGVGLQGLRPGPSPLDFMNSGTGARLMMGVLAAQPTSVVVTGDASLSSRPMERIAAPLRLMGGSFDYLGATDRLPLRVTGTDLSPLRYETPVASAQIKSAVLLAGLCAGVNVVISEDRVSRDHTERMFSGVGIAVSEAWVDGRWEVGLRGLPDEIDPLEMTVPGDISSAAFMLARCALAGSAGQEAWIENVGLNPTRTGFLSALERMGVSVHRDMGAEAGGEAVGRVQVCADGLNAIEVRGAEIPSLIDEIPILAVLAARADGVTRITGAKELRVKETDRITAMVDNLRAVGVEAAELEDGLEIVGNDRPLAGNVRAFDDHRIAMAFGVLGALPGNNIHVDHPEVAVVSYPAFWGELTRLDEHLKRVAGGPS